MIPLFVSRVRMMHPVCHAPLYLVIFAWQFRSPGLFT